MQTRVVRAPLGHAATAIAERDGVRWIVADHEVTEEDVANFVEFFFLQDRLSEMADADADADDRAPVEERFLQLYDWVAERLNANR